MTTSESHQPRTPQPPLPPQLDLPPLAELEQTAHVVSIPTRTRFRGVSVREAIVFDGPAEVSEFSPFVEYDDREAANWLRAAIEFGWQQLPAPQFESVPVNATIPAIGSDEIAGLLRRFPGAH